MVGEQRSSPSFSGANHQSVRRSNRAAIFRALHALAPIARVDLARQSGLNPGTVTNIIDELLESGLVRETERFTGDSPERRKVGRRPVNLEVNPDARFAIGIDLARNTVTGSVVNLAGDTLTTVSEPAGALVSSAMIEQVIRVAHQTIEQLPEPQRQRIVGAGVGAPGALSFRSGRFQPPPSYGDWKEIDLQREIEAAIGLSTTVDNNANTAALAELWFGAGAGMQNFALLNLGTGVGAGLVLDGDLYRGEHDLAGEIGHVSIAMDGPRCACGNSGCLEMYVSVPRVLAAARAAMETGEPTLLRETSSARDLTMERLITAAESGDSLALRVLDDVARFLAVGIVNIINTLDPGVVFIGRELAAAGDILLDPVREEVRRRVLPVLRPTVRIEAATFPNAPVVGAAVLALQKFFAAPLASADGATPTLQPQST
jgi:glucokinase-like ROK family protein